MKEVSAIIVDDEQKNRDSLEKMIFQFCPSVKVLGKASNIFEAYDLVQEKHPDVIFLDIEMPEGNGFELLEKFDDIDFSVIFTTAHADYAIKALKFAALDYLLKPINLQELKVAVEKIQTNGGNQLSRQSIDVLKSNRNNGQLDFRRIALPTQDGLEFFDVGEIMRCEADRAYCSFHTVDGRRLVISKSMKEYESMLTECNFFRVHKSHMINLKYVKKYIKGKGGYVILTDDTHIDVSVRKKEEFLKVLAGKGS